MNDQRTSRSGAGRSHRIQRILVLAILLVAAFFRLWRLSAVPPGLTHDEANNVHDAAAIVAGQRPLYFPVAQGKEPLYPYSVAAVMWVLGATPLAMRLTSAAWGLLLVVLTYAWCRRAFSPSVALLTTAGLAVGFWPVTTSRLGLRAIALPVLFTASAHFLWRGIATAGQRERPAATDYSPFVLSGVALGLSQYTYLAGRLLPAVVAAFGLYLALFQRTVWQRTWRGLFAVLVVAGAVAAPLFLYLSAHPSAEIRVGQLTGPLLALSEGHPGPFLDQVRHTLLIFSFRGDTFVPYNLPSKPLLGPVMSLLFYAGLLLALWKWRQPAFALGLLWLIIGMAPALATGVEAANLRAIGAQPMVYLFPALSIDQVGKVFSRRRSGAWFLARKRTMAVLAAALFSIVAVGTYRDYFVRWAEDRDVRVHYHADLVAIAEEVREDDTEAVAISAIYPGQYHDPRVVEAQLGGEDDRLRWFDGRGGLVLPAGDTVSYVIPSHAPIDEALLPLLAPDLALAERITIRPDDLMPSFDVHRWPGARESPPALAQIGDQLLLLGAEPRPDRPMPGDTVELVTTWAIVGRLSADRDAVIFAQVLDAEGNVLTQQDRLDVPSWNWHVGDQFAQLFRLTLPTDSVAGSYRLIVGVYTVPDRVDAVLAGHEPDPAMPRLPVYIDGQAAGDLIPVLEW